MMQGKEALQKYLEENGSWPLRDYVPYTDNPLISILGPGSCKGRITRSEPDDDINYTVLALLILEAHGKDMTTHNVASAWLKLLPAAMTFTAEREAFAGGGWQGECRSGGYRERSCLCI